MKLSFIVAAGEDGVIGREGDMPWRLSADLRRFKALTMGHHLLLGRKTWESIGRPLKGRKMLVITRREGFRIEGDPPGVEVCRSPAEAVERARACGETEAFVAGGGEIYRALLPRADRLYLTRVYGEIEGDTFFPELDLSEWREVSREELPADERNSHRTTYAVWDRVAGAEGGA